MNHHQKHLSACLIALAALFSTASIQGAWAAPVAAPVPVLLLSDFAVLGVGTANPPLINANASTAVTTTGSTINGNVGSAGAVTLTGSTVTGNEYNTGALVGVPPSTISGTSNLPLPSSVVTDFYTAYNQYTDAGSIGCGATPPLVSGTQTLPPGVYCNRDAAGVTFTGSTLTLDGTGYTNPVWIFKIFGAGGLTFTNSSVVMLNGQACNVTWWVDGAAGATGTTSGMQGTILAGAAITMTGSITPTTSFNGGALAKAAVTLTGFAVTSCTTPQPLPPSCDTDNNDGKGKDGKGKDCDGKDKDGDGHDKDKDHKDDSRHSFKDGGNPFDKDGHGDKK
jgi:hypothetical protein